MTVIELQALIGAYEPLATIDIDSDGLGVNRGRRRCIMSWAFLHETAFDAAYAHVAETLAIGEPT